MSEDSKGAWLTLLAIALGVIGWYVVSFMINYDKKSIEENNPVHALKKDIDATAKEIRVIGQLDVKVPSDWSNHKDIIKKTNADLNYLWWQKNEDPEGIRLFELRLAIGCLFDARDWLAKKNLVDAERYLKAAKDHVEIARKIKNG